MAGQSQKWCKIIPIPRLVITGYPLLSACGIILYRRIVNSGAGPPTISGDINITRTIMMDSRNAANIEFSNVTVSKDGLVGTADNAFAGLDSALDRGRAILCAEMLGGSMEMFQRTMDYLKEREEFLKPGYRR